MASFNEGGFEDVRTDVQITPTEKNTEDSPAQVPQFDTSTSAYLFDLAIAPNDTTHFTHGVLERHEHFHIKGIHPHPTYSFRFGSVNDSTADGSEGEPARLWAQRHLIAMEPYYVISASPFDMDASKKNRSEFYLGKLKESHGARCFTGYSSAKDNAVQNPTVCVIYDHERAAGERKMEVGLPLPSGTSDPCSATLENDFHKVRREGAQNHCPASHPVLCFHQKEDAPAVMSDEAILQHFVIEDSACATRTSTKNFQLTKSHAARASMLPPPAPPATTTTATTATVATVPGGEEEEEEGAVLVQMGKLDDNVFSCAYKGPFTFLQVFMICLSRFETKQAY